MGVDAEDVNGDGLPDLFVTNYWNEPNALFVNLGGGRFAERTRPRHDARQPPLGRLGLRPGRFRQRRLARLLRRQRTR